MEQGRDCSTAFLSQTLTGASWRLTALLGLGYRQGRSRGCKGGKGRTEERETEGGKDKLGRAALCSLLPDCLYREEELRPSCFVSYRERERERERENYNCVTSVIQCEGCVGF